MSLRFQLFLSHFIAIAIALGALYAFVHGQVEQGFLAATEAAMIDEARGFALLCEHVLERPNAHLDQVAEAIGGALGFLRDDQRFKARRLGFTERELELRVRVVDARGIVVSDTGARPELGRDMSRWRDVADALRGEYGARTTLDEGEDRVYLHSALPLRRGGVIVGAVEVARPTNQVVNLIWKARKHLLLLLAASTVLALAAAWGVTRYVTAPLLALAAAARGIAAGDRRAVLPAAGSDEVGQLARAFTAMVRELEGKNYIQRFVTDLSHELKAPLSGIRGAAELLADGAAEDGETRARFVARIQKEADRLGRLVRDLLEISRLDAGGRALARAPVDLAQLAAQVGERWSERARGYGIDLVMETGGAAAAGAGEETTPAGRVTGDAKALEQVLDNLLENALDFTPAGGRVTLSVLRSAVAGVATGTAAEGGAGARTGAGGGAEEVPAVTVEVSDTGAGVAPDLRVRLGERFFTTVHPRTGEKGTGLGLAIAQGILAAHGACLRIESTAGAGSRFGFALPTGGGRA